MNTHVCQFGYRKEKSWEALESHRKENQDKGDTGSEANMGSERRRCRDTERVAVYVNMAVLGWKEELKVFACLIESKKAYEIVVCEIVV